ncbi:MAG: hypothetical protein OXU20_23010 [Myxococcales bacterium]|nr:hypothetical protein [Myxococcales bacterium]
MLEDFVESLSLVGLRGGLIILLILGLLACAIAVAVVVRRRYMSLARDLRRNQGSTPTFESSVLTQVVRDALDALAVHSGDVNSQAIIECNFQTHLKGLLMGERFVKASVGLLIILGLIGTFLGLTLSIGQLVGLVSADMGDAALATQSLTAGLTEALSGMSIAFSTSLFGIMAAVVMTFVNVFISAADARMTLAAELESFLDHTILANAKGQSGAGLGMNQVVTSFGRAVSQLDEAVTRFETSLHTFAGNTRDFGEFNHHLKDNIQRMSLAFSDLKAALIADRPGPTRRGP